MISRQDIQRILHRSAGEAPVLSVFLDVSVNSDNKRTHTVFLHQRRAQYVELRSDREAHHREPLGDAFARIERWLGDRFDEANKGVAVYSEIGAAWLEGLQFPVPVRNRTAIADRPLLGPLSQIVHSYSSYGVILVDRVKLRMFQTLLGEPVHEHTVETDPYPAPHDIRRGGYSAPDYQRRKAEEVRHFFKEFALEVGEFVRRYRPDDLIVLGTEANVQNFLDFLTPPLRAAVIHTEHAPLDATVSDILERLGPFTLAHRLQLEAEAVDLIHDRVRHRHFAVCGFPDTLRELQEGKVDTLILSRDIERIGGRCSRCAFYLPDRSAACPYCGGDVRGGVDLVEAMIRIAEDQELPIRFVEPESMTDLHGVGALLRF